MQSRNNSDPEERKVLEDEQLKIISECSNKLVSLSLRIQKEEKDRKDDISLSTKNAVEARESLARSAHEKQMAADKKVNLKSRKNFNYIIACSSFN